MDNKKNKEEIYDYIEKTIDLEKETPTTGTPKIKKLQNKPSLQGLAPDKGELAIVYYETHLGSTQHTVSTCPNITKVNVDEGTKLLNEKYKDLPNLYTPVYTPSKLFGGYGFPKIKFSKLIFPWASFLSVFISYLLSASTWYFWFYHQNYRLVIIPFITSSIISFFETPTMLAKYLFKKMRNTFMWQILPMSNMMFHATLLFIAAIPINLFINMFIFKNINTDIFKLPLSYLIVSIIQVCYIIPCIMFIISYSRYEGEILKERTEYDYL
ncbi:uncharacterized protein CMU_042390 [Cryptosporidium muris RN66]|uniref:Transmembrane protein n=1 Tax=Cryptosporidium muris (strain RN66) TaxID=441375 RepID=B6AAC5_CRYMR|nr:uncharacterized protein CMU_042390 [Cryptosporidium muris RN66]EEA05166.1 hypothetical protein, conserved [Cryptosporidium muris RN66]|eukprot:XP_002139515.1 hypothetical protein [Cryptosporidium muris RN66]